jgi:hypothetical protein
MARRRGIKGKSVRVWIPEWEPLLDLAPLHVADFIWMFAVELKDGSRVQAYKHYWTRDYVHLDGDGRTFVFVEPDRYEEVEPAWLLSRVLNEHMAGKDWLDLVHPHRPKPEDIRLEWTDSATKNGISRERSEYVVKHCGLRYKPAARQGASGRMGSRTLFLGVDEEGVELEVVAIGDGRWEGFVVFHAAEMRAEYGGWLAKGERWRK